MIGDRHPGGVAATRTTRALSNLERDLVRQPWHRTLAAVLDVLASPAGDAP
ncbi:hypothetical protein [Micromonospora sp. NPDC049891]|uniref:hypothetical protein n=1 Tax=Micromonospora sp. NPDC049891 TaxID=3155655 RepID=UPI00340DCEE3